MPYKKINKENYVNEINNDETFNYIGIINKNTYNYSTYINNNNTVYKNDTGNLIIDISSNIQLISSIKYYYKIIIDYKNPTITIINDEGLYKGLSYTFNRSGHNEYELYIDNPVLFTENKRYVILDESYSSIKCIYIKDVINKSFNYYTNSNIIDFTYYSYDNIIFLQIEHYKYDNKFYFNNKIIQNTITCVKFKNIYYKLNNDVIYKNIDKCLNPYMLSLNKQVTINIIRKIGIYYKILINEEINKNNVCIKNNFNKIDFEINNNYITFILSTLSTFQVYFQNILYNDYEIIDFMEYNYENINNISYNYNYYTYDNEIFYKIKNNKYYIIDSYSNNISITLCEFNNPILIPSIDNIIDILYITNPDYYILCYDLNNIKLIQIKDIENKLDNINYHCWLYKNNNLKIINKSYVPEYSIYEINNNFYYNNTNLIISQSYNILDNNMFNTNQKQLLEIKYTFNNNINYYDNLYIDNNNINIINNNVYDNKSTYNNYLLNSSLEYIDYTNVNFPNIKTSDFNYNYLNFTCINNSSYIIIDPSIIQNTNIILIGSFTNNYIYSSNNEELIINGLYVYLNITNIENDKLYLWSFNVIVSDKKYHLYLWTIITNNNITNPNIIQPQYINNKIETPVVLSYKYYSTNRHNNINKNMQYNILELNYNSIFNLTNNYIYNNIILIHKYDIYYDIIKYDKLYLEKSEIILLDNNKFIVLGLNVFNNFYELQLLNSGNIISYNYNGYYSIYKPIKNKIITKINNIFKYYKNIKLSNY
jgi:hypothetical protein